MIHNIYYNHNSVFVQSDSEGSSEMAEDYVSYIQRLPARTAYQEPQPTAQLAHSPLPPFYQASGHWSVFIYLTSISSIIKKDKIISK